MPERGAPLVIVAFDAGDLRFIRRWVEEGRLPALASIMERGAWGRIAGPELVCEHGSWRSAFSGVSRAEHGYYCYRQLQPGSYHLHDFSPADTATLPFWACLREGNRRVAVIDAPEALPVPGLPGVQLANWAAHQPARPVLAPSSEPADALEEIRRVFGPVTPVCEFQLNSSLREDREMHGLILKRAAAQGAVCRRLLARGPFDLVVAGFYAAHTGGHRFWDYRPEAPASSIRPRGSSLAHAVREMYEAVDREIGLLLRQLGPNEGMKANVVVLSTFGMKDTYPVGGLADSFCQRLGYHHPAQAGGAAARVGGPLALARRVVPQGWRERISHCLPRAAQERLLDEQLRLGTDWSRTTAFAIPTLYEGFIRVNLAGREPEGIVRSGAEYEDVLDRLEADLRALRDPMTGASAVETVTRTAAQFGGGPPAVLPDLFVSFKPAPHFISRLLHPRAELTQPPPAYFRSNEHSPEGFLAAAGPSIPARGDVGDVEVQDLAPTFLTLLGEPVPPHLRGRSIDALLGPTASTALAGATR
jgi:predicted AlkP superfamily phosphohydrolase/phosphomutase